MVHGDAFTVLRNDEGHVFTTTIMQEEYGIKLRKRIVTEKKDHKSLAIPNRCVEWRHDGTLYEADPRHAEIIVREMGIANAAPAVTAGVKTSALPDEDDPLLDHGHAHQFRRVIGRGFVLAQDRSDIQFAVKETARGMASPRQSHWDKLARRVKDQTGRTRRVLKYSKQVGIEFIHTYGDSDFEGKEDTRTSISSRMMCIGDHVIESRRSTQSVIALRTGQAELYAINKSAANGLGAWSAIRYGSKLGNSGIHRCKHGSELRRNHQRRGSEAWQCVASALLYKSID